MKTYSDGITIDTDPRQAHPFFRRQLMNAVQLHLTDGLMLFLAMLSGDLLLFLLHGIPVQMEPILLLIPAWWTLSWLFHLVPGWGLGSVEELRRTQLLLFTLFAAALVVAFLQRRPGISRISFLTAYLAAAFLIPVGRVAAKKTLIALNAWGLPTAIYGTRETVPQVVSALGKDRALGFYPQAVFSDDYPQGRIVAGLPVLGQLLNTTRRMPVAIVALPELPRSELIPLLEGPLQMYRTILLIPDLQDAPSLWVKPCDFQGILGLEIRRNLLDPVAIFLKSFTEYALVVLTLPLWGPLCLFFMLLIWLQDFHSPIYAQERVGRNNRTFNTYKLRTMVPDAERVLARRLDQDPALKAEWEKHYKLRKDPRVTLAGRFLRKTSLDELPQLWCVLNGSMALVGPRPLPRYHHSELQQRTQRLRARVRPGITGLWQISGRSDSGTLGMDKWDTYYVTNWSIWLDIVILARTAAAVLLGRGAY